MGMTIKSKQDIRTGDIADRSDSKNFADGEISGIRTVKVSPYNVENVCDT